uniref:Potassium channel domain-containing protein n=1 Tax=Populus davidiana TaxID=266767 RepID=A0A6M2EK39_9ROSI
MASNGAKQSFLSGLVDPTSQRIDDCSPNRKRFRSLQSTLAEFVPSDVGGKWPLPSYEFLFGGLHQSLKTLAMIFAVYVCAGTMCFYAVRDDIKGKTSNPILDSLYFCIVTMTTVGYGDLVPSSGSVKLAVCVFVFIGMALVGLILSKAGDYLVEKQEILLVEALHMHQKLGPAAFLKETDIYKVKYKCYLAVAILSGLMMIGSVFLYMIEDLDAVDSFYCVCSTISTLGYGDKSFSTGYGRMFAVVWIMTGTVGLGQLYMYIVELFTESRQRKLVNWVLTKMMANSDFEAVKIDDDAVGTAELILYKLKEMGKISQEDMMLAQTTPMKK